MNWITGTLGSSIGKKLMMAITGISFCVIPYGSLGRQSDHLWRSRGI